MSNRIAIIDLGTNTFHLLIAEWTGKEYRIVFRDRQAVKIGKGGINDNRVTPDAMARAMACIRQFKTTINHYKAVHITAIGTSALRNASNQQTVLEKIKTETGITVSVISGDQEAELIYYGVRSALSLTDEKVLIMDIGGGSVEFIIGNKHEITWKASIEIGAQRLLEKFQRHDPILPEEIKVLNDYFELHLHELLHIVRLHNLQTLAGSSGTFDTLSEIYCLQENIVTQADATETPLSVEGFYRVYNSLISKNRSERLAIPGMIEMRVDMIVVACCLIRFLIERHPFKNIRVSAYSMKEGVLATMPPPLLSTSG